MTKGLIFLSTTAKESFNIQIFKELLTMTFVIENSRYLICNNSTIDQKPSSWIVYGQHMPMENNTLANPKIFFKRKSRIRKEYFYRLSICSSLWFCICCYNWRGLCVLQTLYIRRRIRLIMLIRLSIFWSK